MADISKQLEELLLLLRSKHSEGENLQVDSIPTSLQLPESPDFNRPDPKPNYVINATADVTKASSPLPNRTIKCHRRISLEEIEERRLKGLCLFCEESETPDHYLLHKNSGILMIDCDEDQRCDDEELVEMEVVTESNGIEVNKQRQFQVPVSDYESLRSIEPGKVDLGLENQEQVVLNDNLEKEWVQKNISKRFEVGGDVERGQKVPSMKKICSAHQVFGKMSQHETLGLKKKTKGFKSWRFKFKLRKQQRGKLRSAHQLNHRRNVMYKYICSSAKVVLMKKNKSFKTWPTLKDDCFREDDQVYLEGLPLWLLVRFKFWKFKFMNRKLQKMMREHGYFSYLKLKSDVGDDEVFEQIVMVNEWLQTSWVIQQVMRNKKIKFSKRWWFKYKEVKEGIQRLHILLRYKSRLEFEERFKSWSRGESWRKHKTMQLQGILNMLFVRIRPESQEILSKVKLLLKNSLVITGSWRWFMMVKGCPMLEHASMEAERHCYQGSEQHVESLHSFIGVVGEVLFHHSHGLSNRLHRQDLQDLQPLFTLGEVKFQIKLKWNFKGKGREVREELSYLTSREIQEDSSHYFLLVAAANQSHIWSAGYHVWHRWKARCFYVGMISTMRAWLFGEEGFDIGNEVWGSNELEDTWTAGIRSLDQRLRSFPTQDCCEKALKGSQKRSFGNS